MYAVAAGDCGHSSSSVTTLRDLARPAGQTNSDSKLWQRKSRVLYAVHAVDVSEQTADRASGSGDSLGFSESNRSEATIFLERSLERSNTPSDS